MFICSHLFSILGIYFSHFLIIETVYMLQKPKLYNKMDPRNFFFYLCPFILHSLSQYRKPFLLVSDVLFHCYFVTNINKCLPTIPIFSRHFSYKRQCIINNLLHFASFHLTVEAGDCSIPIYKDVSHSFLQLHSSPLLRITTVY